jgi:hypothetical protein
MQTTRFGRKIALPSTNAIKHQILTLLLQELKQEPGQSASDLAGHAIDELRDRSATTDEQTRRKRQLINGPVEFREMRGNAVNAGSGRIEAHKKG